MIKIMSDQLIDKIFDFANAIVEAVKEERRRQEPKGFHDWFMSQYWVLDKNTDFRDCKRVARAAWIACLESQRQTSQDTDPTPAAPLKSQHPR